MQKLILLSTIIILGLFNSCSAQPALKETKVDKTSTFQKRQKEVQTILHIAENYLCNPFWTETEEWKSFATNIQSDEMLQMPLEEFIKTFNRKRHNLPFTHFYLNPTNAQSSNTKEKELKPFEWKEVDTETALLTIRSFVADAPAMIQIVQGIQAGNYENLIIDLRNNTGGTLDAAVVLGRFLTNEPIDAGTYLSRKWFLEKGDYPSKEQIQQLPFLQDMSFNGFGKLLDEKGAFRMVLPPHNDPVFQGKVFVLTNGITGSTCEPLVDRLKKSGQATIVGEKTAGSMLSGRYFKISNELRLFMPVADYITAEGTKIDKVGVEPNISVAQDRALEHVLELLN